MFGVGRRTASAGARCLASAPRARAPSKMQLLQLRDFHPSQQNATFQPPWMPMRVKIPWIDALTKSREEAKTGGKSPEEIPKPDLTPKRMSDSYYSAVSIT